MFTPGKGITIKQTTMAKKKKRGRRRVGGFGLGKKDTGMKLLAVAGGFLLGDTINGFIDPLLQKKDPTTGAVTMPANANTLKMVGEIGLGGLLLLSKKPSTIKTIAGGVLAGAGLKVALKSMGILSGYQSVPVIGRHRMSGYQSVPVIGNRVVPPQLSGKTPAQLQGYRVGAYGSAGSGVMNGCGNSYGGSGSGITGNHSVMQ